MVADPANAKVRFAQESLLPLGGSSLPSSAARLAYSLDCFWSVGQSGESELSPLPMALFKADGPRSSLAMIALIGEDLPPPPGPRGAVSPGPFTTFVGVFPSAGSSPPPLQPMHASSPAETIVAMVRDRIDLRFIKSSPHFGIWVIFGTRLSPHKTECPSDLFGYTGLLSADAQRVLSFLGRSIASLLNVRYRVTKTGTRKRIGSGGQDESSRCLTSPTRGICSPVQTSRPGWGRA